MANVFSVNVYQINGRPPIPLLNVQTMGFPNSSCMVLDEITSPTRSLSTGVNVYSALRLITTGDLYYCRETYAQLITLIG